MLQLPLVIVGYKEYNIAVKAIITRRPQQLPTLQDQTFVSNNFHLEVSNSSIKLTILCFNSNKFYEHGSKS